MRDDQHAAGVILQEALEPLDHVDVEMVRRLVEEQEVRFTQQCLRQADARLLTAGEMCDILLEVLFGETEAKGHAADTALKIVAAKQFKAFDHLAVGGHRLLIGIIGNLLLQCLLALSERDDIIKSPQELLVKRTVTKVRLLFDVANRAGVIELDCTAIRFFESEQAAHQRRLASTIGTDKTDLVTAGHLKTDIVKELVDAKGLF